MNMRLIDADALIDFIEFGNLRKPHEICFSELGVVEMVKSRPVIDAAPVVRCRDCKHQKKVWNNDKRMKEGGYWIFGCERNQDTFVSHTVDGYDDDFCSHGERKEEKDG